MRSIAVATVAALAVLPLAGCLGGGVPTADEGDCLQVSQLGTEVESLPTVSCDDEHDATTFRHLSSGVAVPETVYGFYVFAPVLVPRPGISRRHRVAGDWQPR